ncbi:MAG: propionyl-CoA carboxylase alpha subunit PccA [Bacteroidetes bacterium HLUCCA01]|nr:MAG: propionyl-CoA carboxylase alpha subunit PccA [Bacteroidetes bacterium HLUCCA01]
MKPIRKVLIANRGEIAVRVIRGCKSIGVKTVGVFAEPDRFAPHVLLSDESVDLMGETSAQTYLDMHKIIDACKRTQSDAVHPGYGFLSENATFAKLCSENNIEFIGPPVEAIRVMGDKTEARKLMESAGIPLPPGTTTALESVEEAAETAAQIGFPVLIKAAAGGGGKGMRIVYEPEKIRDAVRTAQSEAKNAFGDDRVYVEKYLEEPRHIEVQILADKHGNVIHLYDRECSIQRRHQKVVEEAPSPYLDEKMRENITRTAVEVAKSCNYVGAGTVEFLADKHRNFYFLEMNTRLQVEHPVTEYITGIDLVEWQIRVARGEKLTIKQEDISINGHAIESRICAEDPYENFLPSTGALTRYNPPGGPGVRVDSGVRAGLEVTINFDPLMAKLVTHAITREKALSVMEQALSEFEISGLRTTIPFCIFVMQHDAFRTGNYDTHFVKNYYTDSSQISADNAISTAAASVLYQQKVTKNITSLTISEAEGNTSLQDSSWWDKRHY